MEHLINSVWNRLSRHQVRVIPFNNIKLNLAINLKMSNHHQINMIPFNQTKNSFNLPKELSEWKPIVGQMMKNIPYQKEANTHYLTIDYKYFTDDYQRREGINIDGNFCVDPYFSYQTIFKLIIDNYENDENDENINDDDLPFWMVKRLKDKNFLKKNDYDVALGSRNYNSFNMFPSLNFELLQGEIREAIREEIKERINPYYINRIYNFGNFNRKIIYEIENYIQRGPLKDNQHVICLDKFPYIKNIPIGEYVSSDKGGILVASSQEECKVYTTNFNGLIDNRGQVNSNILNPFDCSILKKNKVYFMTSNTPYETLEQKEGSSCLLIRINLNHNYDNKGFTKFNFSNLLLNKPKINILPIPMPTYPMPV